MLLALPACSLFGGDDDSVRGIWETRGTDRVYLEITAGRITTYDFKGDAFDQGEDCYDIYALNIVTRAENDYTVSPVGESAIRLVLTLEVIDGTLRVVGDGFSEDFVRSDREVASFTPECVRTLSA